MMTDQQALHEYAVNRDAQAFRLLVEQYQRMVYSAASRRLSRDQDIDDVVQLTFIKLAKSAGAIRRDLAAWLYTTTINTANDLVRRDQTRRRHEALAAVGVSAVNDAEREDWQALSPIIDEVLVELSKPQQSLVIERFFHGRSQRDLAEQLNVSQPTILRRINVAVDEMRKRLADRGYSIATPLLVSAIEKFPQPAIPATLTTELAKVGLSGISTGSATPFSFSHSFWLKAGFAVITLAAIIAGAIELLAPGLAMPQANAAPASQPAAPATSPADWRTVFNNLYALQPNQNLKFIPPPPLPERQRYLLEVEQNDSPMPFIQWRWINGKLKREWMAGGDPNGASLSLVLMDCAKLDSHHISIDGLPAINADGDWIVRDGATTAAILTDLQSIVHHHFKVNMSFEKTDVTKDALVASGKYHLHQIPDATNGGLQIYADVLDHPQPGDSVNGGGETSPAEFWTMLGGYLGSPFVDEAKNEPKTINWLLSRSIENANTDPARRQQIFDNITNQTGLTFKQEKRVFTTWHFSPAHKDRGN